MNWQLKTAVVSAVALAATVWADPGRAAWPVDGAPISVFPCLEAPTATVSDGRGGVYVVWTDDRTCNFNSVYVQRVLGSGSVSSGWPPEGMPVSPLTSGQGSAAATGDGSGGIILVWTDGRSGRVQLFAQRFAPDASAVWAPGGVAVCDAGGDQVGHTILSDGAGGVFVAWMDTRRGLTDDTPHHHRLYDLYAQHIDASGARAWSSMGDSVDTNASVQSAVSLTTDGGSGVLVAWLDRRGPAYFQHLDVAGTARLVYGGVPVAGRFLGETDDGAGLVAPDGAGGMISPFMYGPDTQGDLYAQRVDSTGALVWPLNGVLVSSAPFDQRPNAVLPDGHGGAYIAWHDLRNGNDWDVFEQRITSTGAAAAGWPANGLPVCTMPGLQIYPKLVPDQTGGCILAWYDSRDTVSGFDIYAQRITAAGTVASGWPKNGAALCTASGDQVSPLPAPDGSGGAIVAWTDYRVYADVYAQRVSGGGVVGDSAGVIGVAPRGRREALIVVAHPDPSAGSALSLLLSLPDADTAELTLFDLNGRLVMNSSVPRGTPDPLVMRLPLPNDLRPGLYVVRLSQAGRAVSTKVTILR